jgi:hypothetical protein
MKHFIISLFVVLIVLLVTNAGLSQSPTSSNQPLQPLEKLLNPDGTVDLTTGFTGTLDPKGFTMSTGPNGEPRFIPSADPADARWDSIFGGYSEFTYGQVNAIAVSGTDVYVGGTFPTIGTLTVNCIAKWDGTRWSALGTGVNNAVYAIMTNGMDVYVGGAFTTAGGLTVNRIAKWNGSSWSGLGSGTNGSVYALAMSGSYLYAGGYFSQASGVIVNNVARWDGIGWYPLYYGGQTGVNGTVYALATMGSSVFVGGAFNGYLVRWTGSAWSYIGIPDGAVFALAVSGSALYIGGDFDTISYYGYHRADHIAHWNGTTWDWFPWSGLNGRVNKIVVGPGEQVYVGGGFTTAQGMPANRIAKWDWSNWSALGTGTNNWVNALGMCGSAIYAGGSFTSAGGVSVKYISVWDGGSWLKLQRGVNGTVWSAAVNGSDFYVGGAFRLAGTVGANYVAKWNGNKWSALGSGTNGPVTAIAIKGNEVYAGGSFSQAGGLAANNIAKWDGSSWSALGTGVDNYVLAITPYQFGIYVGGGFITAGGITVNRIAVWNGTQWWPMGTGMNSDVRAIAVSGSDVYAGGWFNTAGGTNVNYIAKWVDATAEWDSLGSGVNNGVHAFVEVGTDLYVGGQFTTAGGLAANRVAKWDGSNWSTVGDGIGDGAVYSLTAIGSDLYAGGVFSTAGSGSANDVAHWNGTTWSNLGSGTNGSALAMAVTGGYLYAGGQFTTAGTKPSYNISRWSIPAAFSAVPSSLSFGNVTVGGEKLDSVTVTNPSNVPLIISSVGWDRSELIVSPTTGTVPPSSSMIFYVQFKPTVAGTINGNINFIHNCENSPSIVPVSGRGTMLVTIVKLKDTDGDANTAGDQSPKMWEVSLYYDSVSTSSRLGYGNTLTLIVPISESGRYIACEADSGTSWLRINGNHTLSDTFFVGSTAVYDTFINFHQNTITVRKFLDNDGNFTTTSDRVAKRWHLELHKGSPTGAILYSGETDEITVNSLGDGMYYAIEADSTDYIHLGYEMRGVSTESSTNNVAITVSDGANVTCDFINAPPTYSQLYRTATAFDWATAYDYKSAFKSVKRKPDKVEVEFQIPVLLHGYRVEMKFPGIVLSLDTCNSIPCNSIIYPNASTVAVVVADEGMDPVISTLKIHAIYTGSKPAKEIKTTWYTTGSSVKGKVTSFTKNMLLYPKPNLHNVGEELFASNAFPTGLLIGKLSSKKNPNTVLLKKYFNVQTSLNKKNMLHTADSRCLDFMITSKGVVPIDKQQTSLPADKHNNKLFAELVALKMNLAASTREKFPPGLGQLTYDDPSDPSGLLNGMMVDSIVSKVDSVISCLTVQINGSVLKHSEVYDVIRMIDSAFADASNFKDTISFIAGTKLAGVRRLIDVPFLHKTPGIEPIIIKSAGAYIEVPTAYELFQNYPNPFNPTTLIEFNLPQPSLVTFKIYNTLGQEVAELFNSEMMDEGRQEFEFDASGLSSGVYFYRITAQSATDNDGGNVGEMFVSVKKMLLLK